MKPDYSLPGWTDEMKQLVAQAYAPFEAGFLPEEQYEFLSARGSYSSAVLADAFARRFDVSRDRAKQIVEAFKNYSLPEKQAERAAVLATKGFTNGRYTFV